MSTLPDVSYTFPKIQVPAMKSLIPEHPDPFHISTTIRDRVKGGKRPLVFVFGTTGLGIPLPYHNPLLVRF
jgi:hypothetical protein